MDTTVRQSTSIGHFALFDVVFQVDKYNLYASIQLRRGITALMM